MGEETPGQQWQPPAQGSQPPPPAAPDPYSGYGPPQQQPGHGQYPQQQPGQQPYGYGYPQQQYQYAQPYVQQARSTNGFAIASLVLGILWIFWLGSVLAVVFGHLGLKQISDLQGREEGRGLAIAGLVLGWIGVVFLLVTIIVAIADPNALDE